MSFVERLARLDVRLFDYVESQTGSDDRRSLLAIHKALREALGTISYLEIGSHLGGSLQAMVADERCRRIVSIDPRPESQPDERPGLDRWEYPDNSTERMLGLLSSVPGADLAKLETVELSTEDLPPGRFTRPDFCFIDGEHTQRAALRDARFCRAVLQGAGVIAFHDFKIIEAAIIMFLRETPRPRRGYLLRDSVFVVELGREPTLLADPAIAQQLRAPLTIWSILNRTQAVPLLLEAHRRGQTVAGLDVRRRIEARFGGARP